MKKIVLAGLIVVYSQLALAQATVTPATALQSYLHNGDATFSWEVKDTYDIGDVKAYALLLTSQKWREFTFYYGRFCKERVAQLERPGR